MDWFKSKTHVAAVLLFLVGAYLVWTGNVPMGVMAIGMGLTGVGIRSNQQRNAEMIARQLLIAKKIQAGVPLLQEEKEQLAADGMQIVGGLIVPGPKGGIIPPEPWPDPPPPKDAA